MAQVSAAYEIPEQTPDKRWLMSIEAGIGLGFMDHTLEEGLREEWFDVDTLRDSSEQDGLGYRIAFGRRLSEDMDLMLYGGGGLVFPGVFFDNHGPFIPPELTYMLNEKQLGLEFRYDVVGIGAGISFYDGTVSLFPDKREEHEYGPEWEGDLANTMGFHLIAGASIPTETTSITTNFTIIYRDIPLDFPATPTGVDPEVFHRTHIEARGGVKLDMELF
jgi:hypothetical protein